MPVLVTDASRTLARRLVVRLLAEGGEVRAYGNGDLAALRAAGARVASGTSDDEGRLEAALTDVHTVVHVGAGLFGARVDRARADLDTMLTAATNAGVSRVIALSVAGASADANDPLRRAKADLESALSDAPLPTVVLRTSLLDTPRVRDALITSAPPDVADVQVAPVRVADVVELIVAFDAARSRATTGHLVVAADGPRRVSVRDYLHGLGHGVGAGDAGRVGRRLSPVDDHDTFVAAMRGVWWTEDPVILDGWRFAGMTPQVPASSGTADPS